MDPVVADLTVVLDANRVCHVVARNADGAVWHASGSAEPRSLGGYAAGRLAVTHDAHGCLVIYAEDKDGVLASHKDGRGWKRHETLKVKDVAIVRDRTGALVVAGWNADGRVGVVREKQPGSGELLRWQSLTEPMAGPPHVVRTTLGEIDLVALAPDGQLAVLRQPPKGSSFGPPQMLAGAVTALVGARATLDGGVELFAVDAERRLVSRRGRDGRFGAFATTGITLHAGESGVLVDGPSPTLLAVGGERLRAFQRTGPRAGWKAAGESETPKAPWVAGHDALGRLIIGHFQNHKLFWFPFPLPPPDIVLQFDEVVPQTIVENRPTTFLFTVTNNTDVERKGWVDMSIAPSNGPANAEADAAWPVTIPPHGSVRGALTVYPPRATTEALLTLYYFEEMLRVGEFDHPGPHLFEASENVAIAARYIAGLIYAECDTPRANRTDTAYAGFAAGVGGDVAFAQAVYIGDMTYADVHQFYPDMRSGPIDVVPDPAIPIRLAFFVTNLGGMDGSRFPTFVELATGIASERAIGFIDDLTYKQYVNDLGSWLGITSVLYRCNGPVAVGEVEWTSAELEVKSWPSGPPFGVNGGTSDQFPPEFGGSNDAFPYKSADGCGATGAYMVPWYITRPLQPTDVPVVTPYRVQLAPGANAAFTVAFSGPHTPVWSIRNIGSAPNPTTQGVIDAGTGVYTAPAQPFADVVVIQVTVGDQVGIGLVKVG
jgi:hypothetical protein